jgi:hypothetical protein
VGACCGDFISFGPRPGAAEIASQKQYETRSRCAKQTDADLVAEREKIMAAHPVVRCR